MTSAAAVAAAQVACMDGPDGPVGPAAWTWARSAAARAVVRSTDRPTFTRLARVADALHRGAGLGEVDVRDLLEVWDAGGEPTWVARLVGEFLARVPGVDDPVFVQALLASGREFIGTFDDLVTVATALAA